MHSVLSQLELIQNKIKEIANKKQLKTKPKIIVITKTFALNKFVSLLDYGHVHYGENKVQEAEQKWVDTKKKYNNLKLHMVGKLQTNKAKKAVELFDYIHSLDNEKLALKISQYQKELNRNVKLFIQVNIANEDQKSGIIKTDIFDFYNYFKLLKESSEKFNLKELSMGMSSDFEDAILNGSTFLRLGTIIMGERKVTV